MGEKKHEKQYPRSKRQFFLQIMVNQVSELMRQQALHFGRRAMPQCPISQQDGACVCPSIGKAIHPEGSPPFLVLPERFSGNSLQARHRTAAASAEFAQHLRCPRISEGG